MNPIFCMAGKEIRDGLRNRWILAITIIFAVLSVGLAYFGAAAAGKVGFTSLSSTIVSLASLAVFIIPLIAMMLAYDSLVGEDESGTLLLLMTYPLSRWQLLLGKMMGHGFIMAFATFVGFSSAAVMMGSFSETTSWQELFDAFSVFIGSAVLLGWIFISFAYIISASVSEKSKAAGLSLIIWFLFVLVFDLGLLALLVGTKGDLDSNILPYLLLFNPTDIFRLANVSYFASEQLTGLIAISSQVGFSMSTLFGCMFAWLVVPTSTALILFNRRKL